VRTQQIDISPQSDPTPPTTAISCNGASCNTTAYTGNVIVSLKGTDNPGGWGVDRTYYTTDGSTPTTGSTVYTGPFNASTNETIRFCSTDLAGNAETPQSQPLLVTPVSTIVSLTWDDGTISQYSLGWTRALQPHGMHGTFFINSGNIEGGPGFMT